MTVEIRRRSALERIRALVEQLGAADPGFLTQIDVRCSPDDAVRVGFPTEPNTVTGDRDRQTLWLGPDEWLVIAATDGVAETVSDIEAALDGAHRSVVDVSANRAVIELRSDDRLEMLASGCPLDLDPRGGWVAGRCAETVFAHAQVLLQELDGATRVFVRPSFAQYVLERLLAARSVVA